ncbi:hypothetical protein [Arsukibacterium sp.]|uniref:hypothetical protein n=1 Tax=Arsukibacterium sp. TaxID=1977258 RepID=UPI003566F01C
MKNNLGFFCFAAALCCFSKFAYSNCEGLQCEGVTNTFVKSLKTTDSDIFLTFPAGVNASLSCELQNGVYANLNTKSRNFSSTHSILLTAIASNAPLVVEFDPVSAFCEVSSVEILVSE